MHTLRLKLVLLFTLCASALETSRSQQKPAEPTQAARPQRTEAEARALAERHRQEREKQRKETGKPVELIPDSPP